VKKGKRILLTPDSTTAYPIEIAKVKNDAISFGKVDLHRKN